eukprot:2692468-Alexandrium_andersonii.AAC.1
MARTGRPLKNLPSSLAQAFHDRGARDWADRSGGCRPHGARVGIIKIQDVAEQDGEDNDAEDPDGDAE